MPLSKFQGFIKGTLSSRLYCDQLITLMSQFSLGTMDSRSLVYVFACTLLLRVAFVLCVIAVVIACIVLIMNATIISSQHGDLRIFNQTLQFALQCASIVIARYAICCQSVVCL